MSKNIKVQLIKTIHQSKLETLLNSYNSLKSILSPNLSENNNTFISSLIDLIISQLKFFVSLLSLNEDKKIYEMLNSNNQNLSKKIAVLYELTSNQLNSKLSLMNSISERDKNENLKLTDNKESYSLEEKKEIINTKNSDNLEFNLNNNIQTKIAENDDLFESKNNNENQDLLYLNSKTFKFGGSNEKLMTNNNLEKGKNEIIKNLNFNNNKNNNYKEKDKNIQIKPVNNYIKKMKSKNKIKEKEKKIQFNKNIFIPKNQSKKYINTIKLNKYEYPSFNIDAKLKNNFAKKGNKDYKEKLIETSPNNDKNKMNEGKKGLLKASKNNYNDYMDKQGNEDNDKISEKISFNPGEFNNNEKFERKGKKSKTVIFRNVPLPYLIGIETSQNDIFPKDNYISITFSNKILDNLKTPDNRSHKNKLVELNNIDKKNLNSEFKKKPKLNINTHDYFSLDEFLTPNINKNGEKTYLTKKGKVPINQKQKDILEDYINNYLFDEEDTKSYSIESNKSPLHNKGIKEKIQDMKGKENKNYMIKGTTLRYNLNDVTELLQILPQSFKIPLDDFYFRKKKASIFDRSIFKICHKVIDNYKILEGKEDIFQFKRSKSKPKYNIYKKEKNSSQRYQNRNERIYNKTLYSS